MHFWRSKSTPDSLKSVFNVFLAKPSLGAPEVRHVRNREFVRNNVALSNMLSKVIFPHNPIACLAAFFFVDQLSQKKVNANFFISLIVSLVEPALQRLVTSLLRPFFFFGLAEQPYIFLFKTTRECSPPVNTSNGHNLKF